ncbi:WXG100 family type VII secretion target [Glycomyces rhizosphaerae]|uniref:WXG100 family type VII secretion target n=1 Tax=Glycomyces rhizosphaerae TaxID=2054422 RepID=A0ABV7PWV9_9ACTN
MVAKGKGVSYYQSTYTHQQLWDMLQEGDDYAVERAGSIWVSAASGMKAAREEMDTHVSSLRTQWTGPASDEFEGRMNLVKQYSVESEEGMQSAGESEIPRLAGLLLTAQNQAKSLDYLPGKSLDPTLIDTYEDWVESTKNVDPASAEAQSKKTQWQQEYQTDLNERHQAMAEIVAALGDEYARATEETFGEPPPPPPSDMPGNNTYTKPTGGVFSETALNPSNSTGTVPSDQSSDLDGDGFADSPDDLDPVENDWNPGSYDDVDSNVTTGGLASGLTMPGGGGGVPLGGGTGGMGGSTIPGGAGLFGPAQGGSGSTGGRAGNTSPARSGANSKPGSSPARSGAGSRGNNGGRLSSSSRNAINRGGSGNPRGGTRSGYNDDDDEETYTRETWLREDDVDWGQNNVRREELDDDDGED